MDPGSWWPDGDATAGRIPLSALEHAGYCLRQAALIHADGVFADDARTVSGTLAHQNVHEMKNPAARSETATRILAGVPVWSHRLGLYGICDAGSAGTSARRGSQRRGHQPGQHLEVAAPGLQPGEDHNFPCRSKATKVAMAAPGLQPGEDHNSCCGDSGPEYQGQRRDFSPARITTAPQRHQPSPPTSSAGTSAPARITTPSAWVRRSDRWPAAPGLQPRRGSQHRHHRQRDRRHVQRRDFSPGEDHNWAPVLHRRSQAWQRRDFSPDEDHNIQQGNVGDDTGRAAPGLQAPARITTPTRRRRPPSPPRSAGTSARRGSQQPDPDRLDWHAGQQRRDFSPGEDHKQPGARSMRTVLPRSTGISASARITTRSAGGPAAPRAPAGAVSHETARRIRPARAGGAPDTHASKRAGCIRGTGTCHKRAIVRRRAKSPHGVPFVSKPV